MPATIYRQGSLSHPNGKPRLLGSAPRAQRKECETTRRILQDTGKRDVSLTCVGPQINGVRRSDCINWSTLFDLDDLGPGNLQCPISPPTMASGSTTRKPAAARRSFSCMSLLATTAAGSRRFATSRGATAASPSTHAAGRPPRCRRTWPAIRRRAPATISAQSSMV